MTIKLPEGFSWHDELPLGEETQRLMHQLWPNFIVQDSDIPHPELTAEIEIEELQRRFPIWGIRESATGKLVAYISGALVQADLQALPEKGWAFAIESALTAKSPNCFCMIVANVDPAFSKLGLSECLLERAKLGASQLGFQTVIAPVRPIGKKKFQDISMEEYLATSSDPWLRLHQKLGGRVVSICHKSVVVNASLSRWEEWLGHKIVRSSSHLEKIGLPEGLSPLVLDWDKSIGTYTEANIWVRYDLKATAT